MRAAFERRGRVDARAAVGDPRRPLPRAAGRVLLLPVLRGRARPRDRRADAARPRSSSPSCCSTRPRSRSSRARRSARPGTPASRSRSATTTSAKASSASPSSSAVTTRDALVTCPASSSPSSSPHRGLERTAGRGARRRRAARALDRRRAARRRAGRGRARDPQRDARSTAEVLAAGTDLVVVGRAGIGLDNVDVAAATRRGVMVVNAPQSNVLSAAEHTIALLLAQARNIPQADARPRGRQLEPLAAGRASSCTARRSASSDSGRVGVLVAQRGASRSACGSSPTTRT